VELGTAIAIATAVGERIVPGPGSGFRRRSAGRDGD
jgi:hypothetical protein